MMCDIAFFAGACVGFLGGVTLVALLRSLAD
jgi:hypothetical protein